MLEYKLYRLDSAAQHIICAKDLLARDDLDALREVEKICNVSAVEIWQGARRVGRVKKDNAELNASDRTSL
jgi:hypothetical protein